jgi:hypothetical protein
MTRVFNLNDQLIFITRNNSLIDTHNKILAKIHKNKIVTGDDDLLALCSNNRINDPKGNPLILLDTNKAYFDGQELCKFEGGNLKEKALGAAGFLFFG